jgi:hypothetical protein
LFLAVPCSEEWRGKINRWKDRKEQRKEGREGRKRKRWMEGWMERDGERKKRKKEKERKGNHCLVRSALRLLSQLVTC